MARRIHDGLRGNSWGPAVGEAEAGAGDCSGEAFSRAVGQAERESRSLWALEVRVRAAVPVAHYGHADLAYERAMNRLQQHGLQLGTKYRSAYCVELVEFLIAAAARARTADMLSEQLPSLGIASDVTLLFDGVSIGASQFFAA